MDENRQDTIPTVPLWQAESTIMHMGHANKRMLIALLAVCLTFIITITVFVIGYTVRERNWLDTLAAMNRPTITEVADGAASP